MIISKGRPVIASDVESKADDFLRTADLDMDKKLSLKEFQSYAAKNRDVFAILDAYSPLLTNNPIGASSSSKGRKDKKWKRKREERVLDDEDYEENPNDEDAGGEFDEEDTGEGDEGIDPDLLAELNKDKEANFRTEEQEERKKRCWLWKWFCCWRSWRRWSIWCFKTLVNCCCKYCTFKL